MGGRPVGPRHPVRGAALGGNEPDVAHVVVVALVVARGGEGEGAAVRRPGRIGVIVVALGHLARLAAVGGHREDLRPPVVGEPLAVEPVLERCDHARRPRLPLLLLGLGLHPAADPRDEGETGPVGRPRRRAHAVAQVGEANRLAPGGGHHVELALLLALALGDERQPRAVRRPARRGVPAGAGGEAAGLAAGHVHEPDLGEIFVPLLGERGDDEGDDAAVGRDLGVADEADAGEIGGTMPREVVIASASYRWRRGGGPSTPGLMVVGSQSFARKRRP